MAVLRDPDVIFPGGQHPVADTSVALQLQAQPRSGMTLGTCSRTNINRAGSNFLKGGRSFLTAVFLKRNPNAITTSEAFTSLF